MNACLDISAYPIKSLTTVALKYTWGLEVKSYCLCKCRYLNCLLQSISCVSMWMNKFVVSRVLLHFSRPSVISFRLSIVNITNHWTVGFIKHSLHGVIVSVFLDGIKIYQCWSQQVILTHFLHCKHRLLKLYIHLHSLTKLSQVSPCSPSLPPLSHWSKAEIIWIVSWPIDQCYPWMKHGCSVFLLAYTLILSHPYQ